MVSIMLDMKQEEEIDETENSIPLESQICLYCVMVIVVYLTIRTIRKRQPYDTDFIYNTDCPICFNGFTMPIKSDCGHGFCLDCLYTFSRKPTWRNMCPLCRTILSNLRPTEESITDTWNEKTLRKIKQITTQQNNTSKRSILYSCFFCAVFLILWIYAVSNLNDILYYIFNLYDTLYDTKPTINI